VGAPKGNERSYAPAFEQINTFNISSPVSFRNLSFFANGIERMTITPNGLVKVKATLVLENTLSCSTLKTSSTGAISCGTAGSSYSAGQGLTLTNSTFKVNSTISGSLVRFTTLSGSAIYAKNTLYNSGSTVLKKYSGTATGNILTVDTKGLVYDATNKRVGVGTASPKATLDTVGTLSGTALTVSGLNAASCDVKASTAGVLSCGTDSSGGGSAGQGITISGGVTSLNSSISGSLVRFTTLSGSAIYAKNTLYNSGSTVLKKYSGTATGNILTVDTKGLVYDATNKRVGVGTAAPKSSFDVVGTISGSTVTQNGSANTNYFFGAMAIGKTTVTTGNKVDIVGSISGTSLFTSSGLSTSGTLLIKKKSGTATGNILTVDTKGLVYDATNKRVGVGTASPKATFETVGTISGSTVLGSSLVSSSGSFVLKKYAGSGTGNILTVDTKGLVYDATNKRVGVGTAAPETTLETIGTMSGNVLNVSANASVFGTLTASGAVRLDDDLTINDDRTAATDATFTFGNATANQTLKFIHATQKFRFSTSLDVVGTLSGSALTISGLNAASCDVKATATGAVYCGTDTGGSGMSSADADARYVQKSGSTMTGGLTVNIVSSTNIVRSTSGTSTAIIATDFRQSGTTFVNVTSQNDSLTISEGTVPASGLGTVSTSSITTSGNVGAGSFLIIRDDSKYIIAHGNGLATGSLWTGQDGNAMTASTTIVSTGNVGAGGLALRRPDDRYLVVHGGGATNSSLFDPNGITLIAAGPTLTSCTAGAGTNAVLTASGNYIIFCGGSGNWGVYNPTANTYRAGTAVGASFGAGAHAIARDDGTFLVFAGGNTSSHWILNPFMSMATMWSTINPITSSAPTITTGAFSIRRADGKFLVVPGAQDSSYIYNPNRTSANSGAGSMTQQSGAGFGPTAALGDGAQAVWRQDGKFFMQIGGGSTATNIIDPSTNTSSQFTAGPTLNGGPNAGALTFMRPDGKYQIVRGAAGNVTETYDMGYVIGGPSTSTGSIFTTECVTAPSTNTGSRLFWNTNSEDKISFKVRTGNGSCSGNYRDILTNGDLIRPTAGHNRVQVQVIFKRPLPKFVEQEWGMRKGSSMTRYRRINRDPVLLDFTIDNSAGVHRTQFEFGANSDPSGPVSVNIVNAGDKNQFLELAKGAGLPSSRNTTNNILINGAFETHSVLTTAAQWGSVVMRRPDGKFVFISGTKSTPNAQLYDPDAKQFSALGVTPTVAMSSGALAFKRPDNQFLLVAGGLNPLVTNLYDPYNNTFTAGPNLSGSRGAGPGAHLIPLTNGNVLIVHGNYTNQTSIYDPRANVMYEGPVVPANVGVGAMSLPRADGRWMTIPGMNVPGSCTLTTISFRFDPEEMTFTGAGSPTITTGVGPGATAFQRSDGQWVILRGGGTATTCAVGTATVLIYNPVSNLIYTGPSFTTGGSRYGAQVMQRPDGTFLVATGNGGTATQIYYENSGAFTAGGLNNIGTFVVGPALITASGTGSISFQTDDGKYVITSGANAVASAGTTTVQKYDAGWVTNGMYASEIMNVTDLDSTSTLSWKAAPTMRGISAEVRTAATAQAIQTSTAREVAVSGGNINPGAGETFVRASFNFKRTFPSSPGIFSDVWYNGGSPNIVPYRQVPTPILQEFSIGKSKDLLNLKDSANSLFRVSTNGDIFTGTTGSVNTGGADLAERYESKDQLVAGEIVSMDFEADHAVRRTTQSYSDDVLGVVSTNPGFIAGAFTKGSYPVALVGRVPVKVTNQGGNIKSGDRITSADLAGYGMKATQGGRVVGIAMAPLSFDNLAPCKENSKFRCGEVMMFVNLSDWPGPKK
jgi:hypothetical protein